MKTQPHKTLDIITVGQSYIDFHGLQHGSSLKDMVSFKKHVGGAPALIAIACARLGLKTAMISRVGDDEMGNFIVEALQNEKIDTTQIKKDPFRPSAFALQAKNKATSPFIFYGEGCAFLGMQEIDIDPHFIANSQALLVCSSSFINESVDNATRKAIVYAQGNHAKIILAMDHQSAIWSSNVLPSLQVILPLCDVIIGSEEEFQTIGNIQNTQLALHHLRTLTNSIFVLKTSSGSYIFPQEIPASWQSNLTHAGFKGSHAFEAKEAFVAGFLRAWLYKASFEKACEYAQACSALVQNRKNEPNSLPSEKEAVLFIKDIARDDFESIQSHHFSHIHYASTRHSTPEQLYLFHFGYHSQWLKFAELNQVDEETINKAKHLIAQGISNAAQKSPAISIISDDKTPSETFDLFASSKWLARSIEVPGEVPLACYVDPDITFTISQWPKYHGVKVSLPYHPDDRYVLRGQQEANLSLLYKACKACEHELLVEIAPPLNSMITTSTMAHIMHRFYEMGIYPDWWQMNMPRDQRCWESINRVIDENDPYCRGIILFGQHTTFEQLSVMFEMAAKQKHCKGFALGMPIFKHPLEQWLAKKISDQALVEIVSANFQKSLELWKKAQQNMRVKKEEAVIG